MRRIVISFGIINLCVTIVSCTTNLLASRNGGFEDNPLSFSYWTASGCTMVTSTAQVYEGAQSAYISSRSGTWAGPQQILLAADIDLTLDKIYAFVGYVRLENLPSGASYVEVQVMMEQTFVDDSNNYYPVSNHPRTRPGSWVEVGADFKLPNNLKKIRIYIQVLSAEVNYFFDSASLVELVPDPNWMTTAAANIDLYRKAKLDLIVNNPNNVDLSTYTVELVQTKSQFGHGTAIQASPWNNPSYSFYPDFVVNTLKAEWVVLENDLKWTVMEATEGTIVSSELVTTLTDLKSKGISVRGHTMFWELQSSNPSWIQSISDSATMLAKLDTRITGTLALTNDRVAHWDVNNEELHSDFLHGVTDDSDLTSTLFQKIYDADPTPALFLNDYAIMANPQYTTAMKNKGNDFRTANVPISGFGAQAHFRSASVIDVTQIKYRLDKLAEAGLPIWITEMSITETDVTAKTAALEEVLTMFFSHEKVEGVLLWGFWTGAIYDADNALATGSGTINLNAAGDKYVSLVSTAWRTNWVKPLQSLSQEPCFKGDYTLYVKQNGVSKATQTVSLAQDNTVVITVTDTVAISVGQQSETSETSQRVNTLPVSAYNSTVLLALFFVLMVLFVCL